MKKRNRALASATVLSLVLTSTVTATNVQAAAEVTRVPGANRETTSMEVAKQVFGTAETVVLVNGYGYADAVSATPLAKALNAPILLTNKVDAPTAELKATLATLGAKNIVIVGGTGTVTPAMEAALKANYTVQRIGGASRYETNAEVAKAVLAKTGAKAGVLVSAEGYADALSVASVAAAKGMPVLFGNKNEVPAPVKTVAAGLDVVAVGGAGVLPEAVLKAVNATRVAQGATRFETNLAVLDHFKADLKLDNIYVAAGGATASQFADALVASAAAAKVGAPVVLTGAGANATAQENATEYIADNMTKTTKVTVIGGTASVSEAIVNDIKEAAGQIASVELEKAEMKDTKTVRVTLKAAEEVTKDSFKVTGNTVAEVKKVDDKTYDLVLGTDLDLKSGTLTVNGKEVKYDFTELKVEKVNATTEEVDLAKDEDDLQLEFTINGGREVSLDDLENAGYTVEFVTSEDVLADDGDETGDLDKEKLESEDLGVDETFDYQVIVKDGDDEVARSEAKKVTIVNNFQEAKQIDDITIELLTDEDDEAYGDNVEITSNKLVEDESAQITEIEYTNSKGVDQTLKVAEDDFEDYDVKFTSSNPSVAFVSKTGQITAIKEGTTTITVEVKGLKKQITITVVDGLRAPKKATVDTTNVKLGTGIPKDVKITVLDQFGDPYKSGDDFEFDVTQSIENADDDEIATATNPTETDEEGKATIIINAKDETGSGKLYVRAKYKDTDDNDKEKTVLLSTITVEVSGLTDADTRKLEKDDSSDDYELDKSDTDDKTDGLVLVYNKYSSKGAFVGIQDVAEYSESDKTGYRAKSSNDDIIAVNVEDGKIVVRPATGANSKTGTAYVQILKDGILKVSQKITVINGDEQMITAAKFETAKITDVQTIDIDSEVLKPENITVKDKKGILRIDDENVENTSNDMAVIYLDLDNDSEFNNEEDIKLGELKVSNSSVYADLDDDDNKDDKVTITLQDGKILANGGKFMAGAEGTIVVKIIDTEDTDNDGKTDDVLASGTITIDIEE